MNERTSKLYTGEKLSIDEEKQLIKERISELQHEINVATIEIDAAKDCINHFEKRLTELEGK